MAVSADTPDRHASAETAAAKPCRNCGDATPGNYCPTCGQRKARRAVSLRVLISEALEDQLSLDAALPRTLRLLITKPGRLTAEYLDGRIARYVPPFRLYIVTSFLFFLAFSALSSGGEVSIARTGDAETRVATPEDMRLDDLPFLSDTQMERLRGRLRALAGMAPGELNRSLEQEMRARAPIVIFLLLPFLAAVLKVLYIGSRRYYVEHFIFAMHVQTFAFILFATLLLVSRWPVVGRLLGLTMAVYIVMAMMHVYRQGPGRTLLKFTALAFVYVVAFVVSIFSLLLFAVLTLPVEMGR